MFGGYAPGFFLEILHDNLYILVLFWRRYPGQQRRAKILEGRKNSLAAPISLFLLAGG